VDRDNRFTPRAGCVIALWQCRLINFTDTQATKPLFMVQNIS